MTYKEHYAEVRLTFEATLRLPSDPEGEAEPCFYDWVNEAKEVCREGVVEVYADLSEPVQVQVDETWTEEVEL